jgi:hypothetical protein
MLRLPRAQQWWSKLHVSSGHSNHFKIFFQNLRKLTDPDFDVKLGRRD